MLYHSNMFVVIFLSMNVVYVHELHPILACSNSKKTCAENNAR